MGSALPLPDVLGWTVSGRHGPLGHVVPTDSEECGVDGRTLLVRGGTTDGLYYHVPVALVTAVAVRKRQLHVDADVADFTAHLRPDGTVDLMPIRQPRLPKLR
jgi:hypothetical protein